jgi:histidinol-phosphate aminotransferase
MSGVNRFLRPDIARLGAYTPIEPVEELGRSYGISPENLIKLDGNENLYGCAPGVRQALASYPYYHIYPDPEQRELRRLMSKYTGADYESIVLGAGSDELIDLVLRLTIEPGNKVINCPPTFGMYPFCTEVCGGKVVTVKRDKDFDIPLDQVKAAIDKDTKVIFIASPNNPSANLTPEDVILDLVKSDIIVVVDEAYYEFSGVTVAPLVSRYDNLIVLRTFSKWAGLAGLRVGYGIMSPELVRYSIKIKQPYNINAAAQVAVRQSMIDLDYMKDTIRRIIEERERLMAKLTELKFLRPYPSRSNFILCAVDGGRARELHEGLRHRGIFIRYFDTPLLKNYFRISVGKPEHTDALIKALKELWEGRNG